MREILFRGKTFHGDWIYGDLVQTNGKTGDGWAIQYYDTENGWMTEDVQQQSIGQFTGLVDSKKVRIYEGDVVHAYLSEYDRLDRFRVKMNLPKYYKGVVVYNERQCKFEVMFEVNDQCGDHHLLSCEFGWGHEKFIVVGKYIDKPFKLQNDVRI